MNLETQIQEARDLATSSRLDLKTPAALNAWFNTPNAHLHNETPLQLLFSGHGAQVLDYLRRQTP